MTRQKKPKLVIAFNATTQALAFDDIYKCGRLIPLPAEVSAGCGLAYCVDLEFENDVDEILQIHNVVYAKKQVVLMYGF